MDNIDVKDVLSILKDFQLKTVNYVYDKLYDDNKTNRFLIADEVGLGKTLVARGIIGRIIDKFQKENIEKRLDIVYICSNNEIAKQNINRLNIIKDDVSHASRITLLPLKILDLKKNRVNFVSFTPGTSFNLGSNGGVKDERALIYDMLREEWDLGWEDHFISFFQCTAGENWENYLKDFSDCKKYDHGLKDNFINMLEKSIIADKNEGKEDIKSRLINTAKKFIDNREPEPGVTTERYKIIGELRQILAQSCISALNPELIILDEFQRFKDLIEEKNRENKLARYLFNYQDVKILLLSATPYKMYTMDYELDEDHYKDFIKTVAFLLDSDEKKQTLIEHLNDYKNILYNLNSTNPYRQLEKLKRKKEEIESILKAVMVRNERPGISVDYQGMIKEKNDYLPISKNEIKHYMYLDKVNSRLDSRSNVEYWKSSSYLLSFMENNYKIKREFNQAISNNQLTGLEYELENLSLPKDDINNYKEIDPANARLNYLINKSIDTGGWKLLWIPPSITYYQPQDIYASEELNGFTKDLIFSSW
ncbi:MAG: DEAD/DEAH box helicase family protein, partial [Halanaerobiales bacterium]